MKNRIYAFLTHLTLSCIIAFMSVAIVFYIWYPAPLHEALGVTRIFLILLAIDIVIGPVITLIIYKPGKPGLKFDLAIIAVLQLAALSYGLNTVFQGRPAFIVFSVDQFEIARANEIDSDSARLAMLNGNQTANTDWAGPRWVAAIASPDPRRAQEIMFSSVQGGPDWPLLPELYVPITQVKAQIQAKAKPLQELQALYPTDDNIKNLIQLKAGVVKWLPLRGKVKDMVVLVDPGSAAVLEILDINPWPAPNHAP